MGLSGADPALEYARAGVASGTGLFKPARSAATRSGYYNPFLAVSINGTRREHNTDLQSVTIQDVLMDQPDTCELDVFGFTPSAGQAIIVGLGSIDHRLFAGTITRVKEQHTKLNARTVYHCTATDWSYLLDKYLVTNQWTSTSASAIATQIITGYTDSGDGFLPLRIQSGLATVDYFPCTFETVSGALTRLAQFVGGYWYVDAQKVVHFFTGDEAGTVTPIAVDSSNKEFRNLSAETALDQVRTKVSVEGMASTLLADVFPVSMTGIVLVPVQSIQGYNIIGGGTVRVGTTLLFYTTAIPATGGSTTTGAVAAGATSMTVASTANFRTAVLGGGWATIGNTTFYYTGATGGTISGIPASGNGSIQTPQSSGATVDTLPLLQLSILASGMGDSRYLANTDLALVVVNENTGAETTLGTLEGGTGVHEYAIRDGRLDYTGASDRAVAETTLYATPITTLTYTTGDQRAKSGLNVSLSMAAWGLSGTYRIQQVQIQFRPDRPWPDRTVTASSQRRDLYDVLRGLQQRRVS
jgi:hypothetical protein